MLGFAHLRKNVVITYVNERDQDFVFPQYLQLLIITTTLYIHKAKPTWYLLNLFIF